MIRPPKTSRLAGLLLLVAAAIGCGGEAPDYDVESLPQPPSMLRTEPLAVGFIRAELDGESREWPALVNAGYRRGSGWQRAAESSGGSARLRGDAKAEERFDVDLALSFEEAGGVSVESVRMRASMLIDGERRRLTFVPAESEGIVVEEIAVVSSEELAVRGRFRGALEHAAIEPIVVEGGTFEARLPPPRTP